MSLIEQRNKHVAAFIRSRAAPGERVVAAIGEIATDARGAVIVTNERIVRYYQGGLLSGEKLEAVGYDAIAAIEGTKPDLGGRGFFLNILTAGGRIQIRCIAGGFGFDDGGRSRMNEYLTAITGAMRAHRSLGCTSPAATPFQSTEAKPEASARTACRTCGAAMTEGARFCAKCGNPVVEFARPIPTTLPPRRRRRTSVIQIILAGAAAISAIALMQRITRPSKAAPPPVQAAPSGFTAPQASSDISRVLEDGIRIPSDPSASYAVLAKEGTKTLPTLLTRRDGSSGSSYAKRRFDCKARTFMYLGEGDSLEELERSTPAHGLSALTEGSISDYWWHYACGK